MASNLLKEVKSDLKHYAKGKRSWLLLSWFFSSRFKLMLTYRVNRQLYLWGRPWYLLSRIGLYFQHTKFGCELHHTAVIGKRLNLPHPLGIVVGGGAVVGDDVTLFQQVTLGSHGRADDDKGYPTVESGAVIYTGAKILGGVTIGRNAVVGANSVVLKDVPADCVAVGSPARILPKKPASASP